MADGACEDQVQPVVRGIVKGPVFPDPERLLKAAGRLHSWMSYPLRGETTTMDMSPAGQPPWHVFTFNLTESSAAAFREDVEELWEAIEEMQANLQRARHVEVPERCPHGDSICQKCIDDERDVPRASLPWFAPAYARVAEKERERHEQLGREAAELPPVPPKVVDCRPCRAWHQAPACEFPAPSR